MANVPLSNATVSITVEPPRQPEVEELLALSSEYAQSLYPPESNFLLDIDTLEEPDVTFYVARGKLGEALGCAALVENGSAIRELDGEWSSPATAELKRMFVNPDARGQGVAMLLIRRIETDAVARGIRRIVLETGDLHDAAQALYRTAGYSLIPQFGQYVGEAHSVCFAKDLSGRGSPGQP